jgi:CubicO group peptidase (beta-lactamase class C family)
MMYRSALLAAALLLIPAGADSAALRELLERWRGEHGLPAAAAAVVTADSVLDVAAVGVRQLGTGDSVRLADRFHLGSNAKAMTGFVAAVMVERGLVRWDTRILDVLPGFRDRARAEYREKTLLDLLTHRAGISPMMTGAELESVPRFEGDVVARRLAFAGWLLQRAPVALDTALGCRYSNGGFAVAAAMLEQASGRSWERLMTEELFARAGIDGRFGWPTHDDPAQPWGHYYDADSGRLVPLGPHDEYQLPDICSAAGDVSMSVGDYGRFLQLNLLGLGGRDTIIRSATCRFLHTGADTVARYAVGWGRGEHAGRRVSRHNGSAGTFYCTALVFRDRDLALAIAVNAAPPGIAEAISGLAGEILAGLREPQGR